MPPVRYLRTRVYDNFCDELIRLFKILPFSEGIRHEILHNMGAPADKPDASYLYGRLETTLRSLSLRYPQHAVYFQALKEALKEHKSL